MNICRFLLKNSKFEVSTSSESKPEILLEFPFGKSANAFPWLRQGTGFEYNSVSCGFRFSGPVQGMVIWHINSAIHTLGYVGRWGAE